mmetsp:Transcript_118459/g.281223  ORF Transcript_118459/g.281223 Transcript_118459/m.281223 type:complete len:227 (+) Transcript_118459:441-1121(+)
MWDLHLQPHSPGLCEGNGESHPMRMVRLEAVRCGVLRLLRKGGERGYELDRAGQVPGLRWAQPNLHRRRRVPGLHSRGLCAHLPRRGHRPGRAAEQEAVRPAALRRPWLEACGFVLLGWQLPGQRDHLQVPPRGGNGAHRGGGALQGWFGSYWHPHRPLRNEALPMACPGLDWVEQNMPTRQHLGPSAAVPVRHAARHVAGRRSAQGPFSQSQNRPGEEDGRLEPP